MRARIAVPAAAAAALVVAAAVAASFSQFSLGAGEPWSFGRRGDRGGTRPSPAPAADEPTFRVLPTFFSWTLVLTVVFVLLLVLLVLLALALWRQRRGLAVRRWRRRLPAEPRLVTAREQGEEELLAAVDESLATLADGGDPRAAVIACWVRLRDVAGAAGVAARGSDTATDLVLRLLRSHRLSEPVLAEFAEVYRLARYSPHVVDDQMSRQAGRALAQVREELGRARVGGRS